MPSSTSPYLLLAAVLMSCNLFDGNSDENGDGNNDGIGDADTDADTDTDTDTDTSDDTDIGIDTDTDCPEVAAPEPPPDCLLTFISSYDGIDALVGETVYTYDGSRFLIERAYGYGVPDGLGNWSIENVWTYTYEADGRRLTWAVDDGADGVGEFLTTWTYDGCELLTELFYDTLEVGGFDRSERYSYDSEGRVVLTEYWDSDGGIAGSVVTTYDAEGHVATLWGRDANGAVTLVTYIYDAAGWLIRMDIDDGNNGSVEDVTTYTNDEDGHVLSEVEMVDGELYKTFTYTYDANGNRLTILRHYEAGTPDLSSWTYDAMNNPVHSEYDENNDGVIESSTDRIYDCGA